MAPPVISSTHPISSFDQLQQTQQDQLDNQPQKAPMSEESPCIQSTDITIRTNVDLQDETITTTTIVHLPFQVAQQCPPPKVISWMKSHRPRAAQQSRPQASGQLQALLPLHLKRSSTEKMKKNDHSATVFSIQVTVLGRVVVPPTLLHNTSSDPGPKLQLQEDRAMEVDPAPVKTIPARLNRAETTSYVIHRTFEDFQTLSESALRLQHALDAASYHHHYQESDTTAKTGTAPMPNKPVLTNLRLHHPHPGLYQTLMSRLGLSIAKANQRAFDASSTTHGFDEEGAFERVLELNQYLENVWYWLMPENNPPNLDLSVEKHDIMQWFKPSSMSSQADGRQMKESQQKGSVTFSIPSAQHPARSKTVQLQQDSSIAALTPAPPLAPEETVAKKGHDDHDHQLSEMTSSAASIPSLSSSSSTSSASSMLLSPASSCIGRESEGDEDQEGGFAVGGSLHKSSASASSTLITSPVNNLSMGATMAVTPDSIRHETPAQEEPMPRVSRRQNGAGASELPISGTAKIARHMSFNHVFRSLTTNHHRRSRRESFHQRTTSASMPTSPRLKPLDEEIYLWSTETTKNSHFISSPPFHSSSTSH